MKDLAGVLPNAEKFTRGHYSMEDLAREARIRGFNRIVVVSGRKGNPGIMRVYEVEEGSLAHIASLKIKGVALSRELRRPLPRFKPRGMIVDVDGSPLSDLVSDILVRSFKARLYEDPREREIVARLEGADDFVILEFFAKEGPVGPRLKVAPTRGFTSGDKG
ncbi:MAG: hypothetical protein F7C33_03585 [Desulfurococcales archaeon]|nr:hypothetical protein [Desulfurococcales archaeon]